MMFDLWPVYSGERFRASWPSCLSKGLKKKFETTVVNKPSVFEPLKFYCIYIRFSTKLYRQIIDIPMGTNCALLIDDLFLFCYERDFLLLMINKLK